MRNHVRWTVQYCCYYKIRPRKPHGIETVVLSQLCKF